MEKKLMRPLSLVKILGALLLDKGEKRNFFIVGV